MQDTNTESAAPVASRADEWREAEADSRRTAPAVPSSPEKTGLTCVAWTSLESEIAAWDHLSAYAVEPNPFFESWYLLPSLRHLPATEAVSILRYDVDGQLAGLMPIRHDQRYYGHPVPSLQNWLHPNAFCGAPLIAPGHETAFWRAVLDWADRQGRALFLHLRGIVLDGPIHAALASATAADRRQLALVQEEARAMLTSDLTPDAYLEASLTGKKRKELRRQAARLADEGIVAFARRMDRDGLDDWCDQFLALEASGWKGKAGSALASDKATSSLFRESMAGAAARGRLERLALTVDERPIAMLATFLTPPGAFSYKTAFDEDFARFSPGVLLQRENLAMLGRPEIAWTDSCAAADHPMIDHLWRERRALGSLSIAIGGRARRTAFRLFTHIEAKRSASRDSRGTSA